MIPAFSGIFNFSIKMSVRRDGSAEEVTDVETTLLVNVEFIEHHLGFSLVNDTCILYPTVL